MKQFVLFTLSLSLLIGLTGCMTPTESSVTYIGADGKPTKVVQASESMIKTILNAYKDNSVVIYDNGWKGIGKFTIFTPQSPFPTIELGISKNDSGFFLIEKDQDLSIVIPMIKAIRSEENSIFSSQPTLVIKAKYAWKGIDGKIIYTVTADPKVGDPTYKKAFFSSKLVAYEVVIAANAKSKTILVDTNIFTRDPAYDRKEDKVEAPLTETPLTPAEVLKMAQSITPPITTPTVALPPTVTP